MARYSHIYIALTIVFLGVLATAKSVKSPKTISKHRDFIHKLNQFVSYVDQGFQSLASSVKSLEEDLSTDRELIGGLNLENLKSSVIGLEALEPGCRKGWVKYARSCFKFFTCTNACSVNSARDSCTKEQASLAKCRSSAQQDFFIKSLSSAKYIILGGNDRVKEGTWRWPDGSLIKSGYTNWNPGEPNSGTNYDCMVMTVSSKKWYDQTCAYMYPKTLKAGFVCETSPSYRIFESESN